MLAGTPLPFDADVGPPPLAASAVDSSNHPRGQPRSSTTGRSQTVPRGLVVPTQAWRADTLRPRRPYGPVPAIWASGTGLGPSTTSALGLGSALGTRTGPACRAS